MTHTSLNSILSAQEDELRQQGVLSKTGSWYEVSNIFSECETEKAASLTWHVVDGSDSGGQKARALQLIIIQAINKSVSLALILSHTHTIYY